MATQEQISIAGILEVGDYTGAKNGPYTENPWGLTTQAGATISMTSTPIRQYSGQSAAALDSFIQTVDGTLQMGLLSGALDNLRKMMGMPASTLTGDVSGASPTAEELSIKGDLIGTEEISLYVRTPGPRGPRTYRFPRAKVSTPPTILHGRTGYFEPQATFDLYQEAITGDLFFVEDPLA